MSLHPKKFLCFLVFLALTGAFCSKGEGPAGLGEAGDLRQGPDSSAKAIPIPYVDTLLSPSESEALGEKYRAIFTNENILEAMTFDGLTPFPQWDAESQKKLLQILLFYEENRGTAIPPFEGNCRMEPGPNGCFGIRDFQVSRMEFIPEYSEYLKRIHVAWNLYVEANRLVPWSLLDYSLENLRILFYTAHVQPKLATQHFVATLDVVENYKILRGTVREALDSNQDLVGTSSLETVFNTLEFVGERVTHFIGSARNDMGPRSNIWPYRARDAQGQPLYDARGTRIPLNQLPTPKEILVFRDPHHDRVRQPESVHGPQFHIVNGCWATSKLLQSLLAAVNIPVQLMGDYFNFGGHSGVKFAQIDGPDYYLHHSDNIYYLPWTHGLLASSGILHTDQPPPSNDVDLQVLAVRAIENPSVLSLYTRCAEPGLERRHLPLEFLTDEEEERFIETLDAEILLRRLPFLFRRPSCLDLFSRELRELYKKKTGLDLRGDDDGDGFENHRDCRPTLPDPLPCEDALKEALGIATLG